MSALNGARDPGSASAPAPRPSPRVPAGVLAVVALVRVAAVWGSTFFLLKGVVTRVPAADFLGVRFWSAGAARWLLRPASLARLGREGRRRGAWRGDAYGVARLVQTWASHVRPEVARPEVAPRVRMAGSAPRRPLGDRTPAGGAR